MFLSKFDWNIYNLKSQLLTTFMEISLFQILFQAQLFHSPILNCSEVPA
jgi:hypothetical protein